jgi:hypothetical protein
MQSTHDAGAGQVGEAPSDESLRGGQVGGSARQVSGVPQSRRAPPRWQGQGVGPPRSAGGGGVWNSEVALETRFLKHKGIFWLTPEPKFPFGKQTSKKNWGNTRYIHWNNRTEAGNYEWRMIVARSGSLITEIRPKCSSDHLSDLQFKVGFGGLLYARKNYYVLHQKYSFWSKLNSFWGYPNWEKNA